MSCCSKYHAGMLTERVTIERLTRTADGLGGTTETWSADPAGGVWASLSYLTGTERWEANRVMEGNLVKMIIRHRADAFGGPYYTIADRVVWKNMYFGIISVQDIDFESQWLRLDLMQGKPT